MLNWRYMPTSLVLLLLIVTFGMVNFRPQAQVEDTLQQAVPVIVHYEGVAFQLAGAQNAPRLAVNSRALIAQGDSISTDNRGRALIVFEDGTRLLLLPNSRFTLEDYRISSAGVIFAGTLEGVAIQATTNDFVSYRMALLHGEITQASDLMAMWSIMGQDVVITNAAGTSQITLDGRDFALASGEGLRVMDDVIDLLAIPAPYNSARLVGALDGCEATVVTREATGLLIRRGAGRGFERMNLISDGEVVRVMAQTEDGMWSRVQFLNGFGWMQSLALQSTTCDDLERLPNETLEEEDVRIFDIRDDELDLLVPFFGSPTRDIWFYRTG